MQESFMHKNCASEISVLSEAASSLNERLRGMKSMKRNLVSKFTEEYCDGDKKKGKERIQAYINCKNSAEGESDDDTASILEELLDIEMDIETTARDVKELRSNKDAAIKRANEKKPTRHG